MKGGELIAEYLIRQKVPYVFGICGHGNVGILDPLYEARDRISLISPRHEQCAGHPALHPCHAMSPVGRPRAQSTWRAA